MPDCDEDSFCTVVEAVERVEIASTPEMSDGDGLVTPAADEVVGLCDCVSSSVMTLRVSEGGTTLVPSLTLPSPFPPPNGARAARYAKSKQTTPRKPTKIHARPPLRGEFPN